MNLKRISTQVEQVLQAGRVVKEMQAVQQPQVLATGLQADQLDRAAALLPARQAGEALVCLEGQTHGAAVSQGGFFAAAARRRADAAQRDEALRLAARAPRDA